MADWLETYTEYDYKNERAHKKKYDRRFFGLCEEIKDWSGDTSRHIAAVIVGPDDEIRSTGYNDLPRKVEDKPERRSRENNQKYFFTEHAERNAIFNAARVGIPLKGSRIYCNLFPCADCARAIIQSGIVELNTYKIPENDRFDESFKASIEMLNEAGVKINYHLKEDTLSNK